ncbi:hypothetical protein [Pseudomonas sp. G(2018)]|uniref:hypothetical protein n=1 Tax=Pseudomonas sp. G(2018) TaxID=2502242 RepID=UPI0010F60E94|nr:hypothetical protein [Pseudomonas sp. G(2018)]
MSLYELEGVELEVDLESTEFEGVGIDYYNFIRIVEPDQYGGLPLSDFGGWFEIRKEGVYLKLPDERVLACLTTLERDDLLRHPKGRPYEPVLAFPFTLRELKVFLDWATSVGYDVPINEAALLEVIEAQGGQPQAKGVRHKSVMQQRIEVIHKWLDSQQKFTKDNLRVPESERGKPWARQACWDWLCVHGYTEEGRLFGNAKQRGEAKSKAFSNAWTGFKK